ncbi:MAG: hypothetical protein ISS15_06785 [Alphaproteobacteria bacterium]|nr:hypothetical protein [Alphaproteobacteria bacterium]MBL7097343.1 hypothetical protein [Alphaproteobacteria bacterium]
MRRFTWLAVTAALLCAAAFGFASAQNTGGTPPWAPPAPSPSPSPTPAPNPNPDTFHSPFNGDKKAGGREEADLNALLPAYDALMDAEARLKYAGMCGSVSDVADAYDAYQAAKSAFDAAVGEYLINWSNLNYPRGVRPDQFTYFDSDLQKVMDALSKLDKKQHPVGDCPRTPAANGPPEKKPHPAPPPPETPIPSSPRFGGASLPIVPDCFGRDSNRGSLIADLQSARSAADADPPMAAAIDSTVVTAADTPTCAEQPHPSIWDHLSIGIGIGVGGSSDRRHNDQHGDVAPPQPHGEDRPHD